MNWLKILLIFKILLFSTFLAAQNKQIEKANKRYQIKKYAEAIPLYEEGLAKDKSLSAQTRLAFCYRMNNNIDKAANLYGEIVQNKRARPITWYYFGESLIGQGKYDEAKTWLQKYNNVKPRDEKGRRLLSSIEQVQNIQPLFITNEIMPFNQNSESDDSAPILFNDGIAFSSDRNTGMKVMKKKSSWTGRDFLRLYYAKRKPDGTYGNPSQLSRRVNDMNKNTGTISISPDGSYAVFSRNSDISNSKNVYNLMLYRADISSEGKFKNVQMLSFCNKNVNYMHPTFSPDGNTLYFTSDKKGEGGTDIFYVTNDGEGWSRPKNIGATINTKANEGFPFMSFDGKLFFCSKGHLSFGGFDILMTQKKSDGTWTTPINVGKPINSPADDISIFISADGQKGMFASSRNGSDDDIFLFDVNGYNQVFPSNGFSDTPLAKTRTTATSEMASTDISNQKKMEEKKKELPFDPVQPFSREKLEKSEELSTIPHDPTQPFDSSVPVIDEETIVVDYPSEKKTKVKETGNKLPFEPVKPYSKKDEETIVVDYPSEKKTAVKETGSKLPFEPIQPYSNKDEKEIVVDTPAEKEIEVKETGSKPPFEPVQPYSKDKVEETKTILADSSSEKKIEEKKPETNSNLPFKPVQSKESQVIDANSNSYSINENAPANNQAQKSENAFEIKLETIQQLENDSKKFKEGLATADNSITDEITQPITPQPKLDKGIIGIKDYLSGTNLGTGSVFVLEKVKFENQKYRVQPNFRTDLEELVILMKENPQLRVEISAHTESRGDDKENMVLSIKRATAVAGFLIRNNVETDRVKVMGYGETQLLNNCSNGVECSEDEHALNQRVEVRVLDYKGR